MKTPIRFLCLLPILALGAVCSLAQVATSINWTIDKGQTTSVRNGVNLSGGMSAGHASGTYLGNLAYLKPGLQRMHTTWQTSHWLVADGSGGYAWDADLINGTLNELEAGAPAATWIMTICDWPDDWEDSAGRLLPARYDDYAELCGDLVELLEDRGIPYWECFNEKEGRYASNDMGTLAEIFSRCVAAMKAADPRVLVGPAWYLPFDTTRLNGFLGDARVKGSLGVWTYHHYATGGSSITDAEIMNRAVDIADKTNGMRTLLDSLGYTAVPSILTETNVFWAYDLDTGARMRTNIGATFSALVYKRLVEKNKIDGVCWWNDADSTYGRMAGAGSATPYKLFPPGHMMAVINEHLRGTWVSTTSSNNGAVAIFAVKNGAGKSFMLMNASSSTQTANTGFNGWTYGGVWTLRKIDAAGLTTTTHTWSSLNPGTLTLAPFTVLVCTFP